MNSIQINTIDDLYTVILSEQIPGEAIPRIVSETLSVYVVPPANEAEREQLVNDLRAFIDQWGEVSENTELPLFIDL